MAQSLAQQKAKEHYKQNTNARRTLRPIPINQFEKIKDKFYYEFCPKHGFYTTIKDALKYDGYLIFPWQYDVADAYLESVFLQKAMDINISVLRQVGKTEFVSLCTAFVFEEFYNVFNVPVNIAVFAPVKTTATIMFKRATGYFSPDIIADDNNTKERKGTVKGDQIQLFGIYDETKGSTVEGNTFDIIIRDEAHLGNDAKFIDETEPTRFSKNALLIRIGNGVTRECDYYHALRQGNSVDPETGFITKLVRYTWTEVEPFFEKLLEKNYLPAETRLKNINQYIKKHGRESRHVRKNVYCELMTTVESVITHQQIQNRVQMYRPGTFEPWSIHNPSDLYLGLDIATLHDRTIATLVNDKREVVDWITVKEKNEKATTREQIEHLYSILEQRDYTDYIVALGFDATGLGKGGVSELLEDHFSCDLIPYQFSAQSKFDWYNAALESFLTEYEDDQVKLPFNHPKLQEFIKDWTDLKRKELPEKKYDSFNAVNKEGCYDDYVASFAIAWDMMIQNSSYFTKPTPIKKQQPYIQPFISNFSSLLTVNRPPSNW